MSITAAEQNEWGADVLIGLDAWSNSYLRNPAASLLIIEVLNSCSTRAGVTGVPLSGNFCGSCSYFNRVPMLACPAENTEVDTSNLVKGEGQDGKRTPTSLDLGCVL
jgi:hypothetical protein